MRNIEFANRWTKEVYGDRGKELTRLIATDRARGVEIDRSRDLRQLKDSAKTRKSRLKALVEKGKSDPLLKPLEQRRNDRVKILEEKRKKLASKKQALADNIKKGLEESEKQRANRPPRPKPNVKYKPLPKESRLRKLGKIIGNNKGKLALAAGVGTLGAVGYNLYRKARSDKGKKRRFYNK